MRALAAQIDEIAPVSEMFEQWSRNFQQDGVQVNLDEVDVVMERMMRIPPWTKAVAKQLKHTTDKLLLKIDENKQKILAKFMVTINAITALEKELGKSINR